MFAKRISTLILATACLAGVVFFFLARGQHSGGAEEHPVQNCVRLTFGWRDAQPRAWDGNVEVRGGRLARIEGWRLGPNDSVSPEGAWRVRSASSLASARPVWPGAACVLEDDSLAFHNRHPAPAAGVVLYLEGSESLRLAVRTPQGSAEVSLADLKLGRAAPLLDGDMKAERIPPAWQVPDDSPEQDYPSLAAARDGSIWLSYQSYAVVRHEDRIFLTRLREGRRSTPQDVAGPGDYYRPQVAVDGEQRVWVVWAALVNEDWDLFARYLQNGKLSETQRLTAAPGGDFNHKLAAGPDGRLWLAWQANRSGNWDIFLSQLGGTQWSAPQAVTSDPENDWEPALAVLQDGRVVVAWDSDRRGSFNVYMRIFSGGRWGPEMPVASGEDYEAHAAVAADSQDRLWIAWDNGGPAWGLDSSCHGLYHQRHVDLRAYTEVGWQAPLVKPMRDLPLPMTRFVSLPRVAIDGDGRLWLFFRHWTDRQVYELYAMYLTNDGWSEPVWIPHSSGREYQTIATAAGPDGRLWAAWSSDGSEPRRPQEKHYRVYVAPMPAAAAASAEFSLQRGTPPADTTVTVPREPSRYTTTVGGRKLSLYWGDMHRHTDISSHRFTDGSLEDTYRYGTDVARLDFLAPTDHVIVGLPSTEYVHGDDYHWWRIEKAADLFRMAGVFVPIYAYERSMQSPGGHRNVLHLRRGGIPIPGNSKDPRDNSPISLWERLQGQEVLVFPHTPGDAMQPLIDWNYKNPDFEPLLEIFQGLRSSYEYWNAPLDGRLGGTQTDQPGHFLQDALAKGFRYGVEASSDHLATHISFTGVYSEELSREALFRAMKARHTFAASDKIIVDFRMGDHLMGDEVATSALASLDAKVIGTGRIRRVELVRNNQVIYATQPGKDQVQFRYQDVKPLKGGSYYYLRITQEDGNMAWSSPIWFKS